MDTRLCEYMLTIAREGSIAAAAEKLFLTQSALNQQLLKLERELGTPLFHRVRAQWRLTEAGALYMEGAAEIVRVKEQIYRRIEDLAENWKRTITVGLTAERGMQMFSAVYPELHSEFPNTVFQPVEDNVEQLDELLLTGRLDFSFQTVGDEENPRLSYRTITREPFLVCIPKTHPLAQRAAQEGDPDPVISLRELQNEWFTLVKKTSTMRAMVDRMFEQAGFQPRLLFDSVGMRTMQRVSAGGQCCTVIPRFYAVPDDRVVYFLPDKPASWRLAEVHKKDHYLPRPARRFIEAAARYWQTHLYIE